MMKNTFIRFETAVLLFLAACVMIRFLCGCAAADDSPKDCLARVTHTIDGDTVVIEFISGKPEDCGESETVRLIGVDTPETHNVPVPDYYGPEASNYTKGYTGREAIVVFDTLSGSRDKYKRLLAYLYFDDQGRSLNELLIFKGYGRYYPYFPFDAAMMGKFKAAEEAAQKNKRGLWHE